MFIKILLILANFRNKFANFVSKKSTIQMAAANKHNVSKRTIELIIYLASKLKSKPTYGKVLLEKSLYFCDSMSFLKFGKPITDFKYIKQEFGPTPEPGKYLAVRDKLVTAGTLTVLKEQYYKTFQDKFIANRTADIDVFDKNEIVLIDEVIDWCGDQNATDISNYTHDSLAWQLAGNYEELPFFTFLLTSKTPTDKDRQESLKAIEKYLSKS